MRHVVRRFVSVFSVTTVQVRVVTDQVADSTLVLKVVRERRLYVLASLLAKYWRWRLLAQRSQQLSRPGLG